MTGKLERLIVAGLALAVTYALFFEYFPPSSRVHLWSDTAGYHYPLQAYAAAALRHHRIPLWDATIYCGVSFIGNVQAAFLYPPTWLMLWAARGSARLPFKAYEAFTILHLWLAFCLAYLWLRGRAGKLAAALAASGFAFSGYLMWQTLLPGMLGAAAWLPLGCWGIDQAAERREWRSLWKTAAASAMSFLAGYPSAWLAVCIAWLVYAAASRARWRTLAGTFAALAASTLLAAVQWLPAIEAHSLMQLEPKYGPGAYDLPTLLRAWFLPNWFDFNPGHPTNYEPGVVYLYLGLPAVLGVLWALGRGRWRPYLQAAAVLAAALFLANPPAAFIRLVERFPALDQVLQPYHFYAVVSAMAALVAALALDTFGGAAEWRRAPWPIAAAVVLWAGRQAWFWAAHRGQMPSHGPSILPAAVGVVLLAAGVWAMRSAVRGQRAVLAGALLLMVAVDYRVHSSGRWFDALPGDLDGEHDPVGMQGMNMAAYDVLAAHRDWRIALDDGGSPYSTDLRFWELTSPQGFDPFLPAAYRRRIERWVPFRTNRLFFVDLKNEDMLRHLGVRYAIAHDGSGNEPYLAASPRFRRVGTDDSFYQVFEYLGAAAPYGWEDGRADEVRVTAWKPERRDFAVRSDRPGRFRFVEQYHPGWRATVDGRPVAIERWDGTFQAIEVPAGRHRVRFLFRPASVEIGAAISLLTLAGLVWAIRSGNRPAKHKLQPAHDGAAGHIDSLDLLVAGRRHV